MDRMAKALRRLPKPRLREILKLIDRIESGDVAGIDIVKLRGYQSLYRVRTGGLRLIVIKKNGNYRAVTLENRSERTYKDVGKFE